ncbi:hypothetical protein BU26DRAFT_264483 [Trematosphaeria pertusa]|uniref:Uncharacterized protein n=1 Tax=Trematosphaeria pertusa TaxID=390896 RepID=A0A6A6IJE5_9PLEO|nr:uncharacterized protein BU26DRAFT_264483 [Trematosphaeria pertusa]KAF2250496.1 hypothetical protein BU26DRAFT_264483 [Trematosphaeria pertusa]
MGYCRIMLARRCVAYSFGQLFAVIRKRCVQEYGCTAYSSCRQAVENSHCRGSRRGESGEWLHSM